MNDDAVKNTNGIPPAIYLTIANHWSYVGIGWQLGLESCAQSLNDSMSMADYTPSVKTGVNMDAGAFELLADHYPEVIARFRRYLQAEKVEIVGGSYGQPMGSMVSGECNLRQMTFGQQTVQRKLGVTLDTFLEEEEFSHPQIPQLAKLAGYRFASQAQCDTWGRHGNPPRTDSVFQWKGVDGTVIPATPANALVFHPPMVTHDIDWLWSPEGRETLAAFQKSGIPPLAIKWTEFGWGPNELDGTSPNKFKASTFRELEAKMPVEFVTLTQYLRRFGDRGETVCQRMDDHHKLLPWGVGGDQLRHYGREAEALLLAVERLDALAFATGRNPGPIQAGLEDAWKDLLRSQSHDVSLCEYSRWQGLLPPRDPIMDAHFLTWGSLGYRHLDAAKERGRLLMKETLSHLVAQPDAAGADRTIDGRAPKRLALTAFNPGPAADSRVVRTGKLQIGSLRAKELEVLDAAGKPVPCQMLTGVRDETNTLVAADLLFVAAALPPVGQASWHLAPRGTIPPPATDLCLDKVNLILENENLRLRVDPVGGGVASLVDKRSGLDCLQAGRPFPTLRGENDHSGAAGFDSRQAKTTIEWLEEGPVRATVCCSMSLPGVRMEIRTSLEAGAAYADVQVRLIADAAPSKPKAPAAGFRNGWQLPLEIEDGYWLTFVPGFAPTDVRRDYPYAVEACGKNAIDALTFVDFMKADSSGLLLLHGGSQYFKKQPDGSIANLVMREWESHFTGERGWPRLADYRYRLLPHGRDLTDAERLNASAAFDMPVPCVIRETGSGPLPEPYSLLQVAGPAVLTSCRRTADSHLELRLLRTDDRPDEIRVTLAQPVANPLMIDALGRATGEAMYVRKGRFIPRLRPWQIACLRMDVDKDNCL